MQEAIHKERRTGSWEEASSFPQKAEMKSSVIKESPKNGVEGLKYALKKDKNPGRTVKKTRL